MIVHCAANCGRYLDINAPASGSWYDRTLVSGWAVTVRATGPGDAWCPACTKKRRIEVPGGEYVAPGDHEVVMFMNGMRVAATRAVTKVSGLGEGMAIYRARFGGPSDGTSDDGALTLDIAIADAPRGRESHS